MIWVWAASLAITVFVATLLGTRGVLALLRRHAVLDHPNERSSHQVPTPRGAGLAVVPVLVLAWAGTAVAIGPAVPPSVGPALGAAALLAVVGWRDDRDGLPAALRLACQAVAVGIGLWRLAGEGSVTQGLLPGRLDLLFAGLAWLWFVNLFNFMDGIDGIAGCETVALGAGAVGVAAVAGLGPAPLLFGAAAAAAALGFLYWNWQPARIFLGDVGSVPLGYLLGWLLLELAVRGQWAAAAILPAYYLADATLTLLRRLARGERVWQAHRQHFYQHAVRAGLSHAAVARAVAVADVALIAAALWSVRAPVAALAGAAAVTVLLLAYLASRRTA